MANVKISELPASTTPDDDDVIPVVVDGTTSKVTRANFVKDAQFPEIVEISAATLDLTIAHRGKILKCTHASGCAITIDDGIFAEDDWVQAFGTQDVVSFLEGGTMSAEPPDGMLANTRAVRSMGGVLFLADDEALLGGDLEIA